MSRKNGWSTERKWKANKVEIAFEKLLKENGFTVVGIDEYSAKTNYLIEKDSVVCEYGIYHAYNNTLGAKRHYENFVSYHSIKVENERLKAEVSKIG